jgi:ABC-2 type transport system ATP-binding protein
MDAVVLDNVRKSFGELRAVDGLSVRVPAGSIYGFLGPNGAGKTTTLRMIMDIIRPDPDGGRIEVLGHASAAAAKDRIGYMPEERGLYRKMTAAKVLAYLGAIKGVPAGELARRVDDWLGRVALRDRANRKVEELSRGMHQRLQFAATCINDPDLLVLDEPFAGLDPVNLDLLKGEILRMRDAGTTVIFSTHVMHQAEDLCDLLLLINKGRAVTNGTLDEIRSQWLTDAVAAELEGDCGFVESLPMVAAVRREGRRMVIDLAENADPQDLLRALVARVPVRAFEVRAPSLHEIFVRLIGPEHAQDS